MKSFLFATIFFGGLIVSPFILLIPPMTVQYSVPCIEETQLHTANIQLRDSIEANIAQAKSNICNYKLRKLAQPKQNFETKSATVK
jgi:hypothetical protein